MFPFTRNQPRGPRGEPVPEPHEGLPDSSRPQGLCPRCGKQSSFENVGSLPLTLDARYVLEPDGTQAPLYLDQVSVLWCRNCHHGVAVIEESWTGETPTRERSSGGEMHFRGIHWWPLPDARLSPDIPNVIAGAFNEASMALAANCPRAAVVMARRTLEAVADDKGAVGKTLGERLHGLSQKGVLHPSLAAWIKELRQVGNTGAHYDPINPVSREDAEQMVSFLRDLLYYLYELPAHLARRRAAQRSTGGAAP